MFRCQPGGLGQAGQGGEGLLQQGQRAAPAAPGLYRDVVPIVRTRAGLAVAVGDGVAEAKAAAHYVTKAAGGRGAVRETIELILQAQGKWQTYINQYAA